jgi:phosphoribosylglycinamide formyltransferase-1
VKARGSLALAILISGRGSNLAAIARACAAGDIGAHIACVIANRADAGGLAVARDSGIPTQFVDPAAHATRDDYDDALATLIDSHDTNLVVLAGFMRILGGALVARYAGRMLNIHPALLPRHKGLHTHRRALEARDSEHGCSIHYVTAELDGGPVVLQGRLRVRPDDDEGTLSARVQACEHRLYPRAIGWIAAGRLTWNEGAPCIDGRRLDTPIMEDCDEWNPA